MLIKIKNKEQIKMKIYIPYKMLKDAFIIKLYQPVNKKSKLVFDKKIVNNSYYCIKIVISNLNIRIKFSTEIALKYGKITLFILNKLLIVFKIHAI